MRANCRVGKGAKRRAHHLSARWPLEMVGTRSLSPGRAFARTRWLCSPYATDSSLRAKRSNPFPRLRRYGLFRREACHRARRAFARSTGLAHPTKSSATDCPSGKSILFSRSMIVQCQARPAKIFFAFRKIVIISAASRPGKRGVSADRHERGAGCDGRVRID